MVVADAILQARDIVLGDFGADFLLVTDEDHGKIRILTQSLDGSEDRIAGGEIAAHGIEREPHRDRAGLATPGM